MSISFCEFNEQKTVGEIRNAFNDLDKCQNYISTYRSMENNVGIFDAVAAIILGGPANNTACTMNFCKAAYNKKNNDASTWRQNLWTWTIGKDNNEFKDKLVSLLHSIQLSDSLKDVYDKLDAWQGWVSNDKKEKVINFMKTDNNRIPSHSEGEKIMESDIVELIEDAVKDYKQVIFTGAPGTGKTYGVRKMIKKRNISENDYKFLQFHPSYDYTDFVEGLRPVMISGSAAPTFVRIDGTFKKFCRHIVHKLIKSIAENINPQYNIELEKWILNRIYEIESAKSERNNNFQFISNSKYDEIIIRSLKSWENEKYFFIVDEINRADLSKVFGELMFALEGSYRGIENRFDTQYKNLKMYEIGSDGFAQPMEFDCFEKGFFIPRNLVFIGTMNDIDRSVESFDFALRRRFQWIDIKANEVMESSLKAMWEKRSINDSDMWIERIINMNKKLTSDRRYGLTEAYHIGPAYFKYFDGNNMERIFAHKIEPIIREYLRGRKKEEIDFVVNECKEVLL